jgi:uncharacterized membrane protein YgcG
MEGLLMIRKRLLSLALILAIAVAFVPYTPPPTLAASALVLQSEEYYVADYANVLTNRTKQDIISANVDMENKCYGAQIVIVTIKHLEGMYTDEYTNSLFNDWGVGSATHNNGMLLLLVTEEKRGWLAVGAGISDTFTNKMADDYLENYFWPDVDAGRYDTAVRNICEALFSWFAGYYSVNTSGPPASIARPTSSAVVVNGKTVAVDAYNINDNNYFKLRDLAHILSGSEKQFEVTWDGTTNTIILTSGKPYTPVGGEMQGKGAGDKTPAVTTAKIIKDGKAVSFTAYNIEDNNYFKLRDIGEAFDFGVMWDGATNTIIIDTSKGYTLG